MISASLSAEDDVAIIIVDHGSKRPEANDMLEEFAALYRSAQMHSRGGVQEFARS